MRSAYFDTRVILTIGIRMSENQPSRTASIRNDTRDHLIADNYELRGEGLPFKRTVSKEAFICQ